MVPEIILGCDSDVKIAKKGCRVDYQGERRQLCCRPRCSFGTERRQKAAISAEASICRDGELENIQHLIQYVFIVWCGFVCKINYR